MESMYQLYRTVSEKVKRGGSSSARETRSIGRAIAFGIIIGETCGGND